MFRREGDSEFNLKTQGRVRDLERRVISLASALDNFELNVAGNVIYCDKLSTGAASIRFSSTSNDPLPVGANFGLEQMDFKRLYITCVAQAGKSLNLWFGSDVHIIPPNQDINNIGTVSLLSAVTPPALGVNSSTVINASLVALQTLVTPAANTVGLVLKTAHVQAYSSSVRMMVKTSAPSAWSDTAAMTVLFGGYSGNFGPSFLSSPLSLPAGVGLYVQGDAGATVGCSYDATWD